MKKNRIEQLTKGMNMTNQRLLTYQDLCDMLNRKRNTIWSWVKSGKFPEPVRVHGRAVGWKQEDIAQWLAENCH